MFFKLPNYVEKAVATVGGPTKTANLLSVAGATVHKWIRAERISNIDKAKQLSELSGIAVEKLRPV